MLTIGATGAQEVVDPEARDINESECIRHIEQMIYRTMLMGSLPKTSQGLMRLFKETSKCMDHVTKDDIIRYFREGRIKWVSGLNQDCDAYQKSMSESAIKYLEQVE